jgi:hypothetical protein
MRPRHFIRQATAPYAERGSAFTFVLHIVMEWLD